MRANQYGPTLNPSQGIAVDPRNSDNVFNLNYEALHGASQDAWCIIEVQRLPGLTVIIATDKSNKHQGVSITNRIERVMYLAWVQMDRPWPCAFIEHYEHSRTVSEHFDLVEFETDLAGMPPRLGRCWAGGRDVGEQFTKPQWTALRRDQPDARAFVLPPNYGRRTS